MARGFSLIELLIGMGLVGILLATSNVLLFSSLQSAKKAEAQGVTKTEGAYALTAMSQVIKFASSIESCTNNTLRIRRLNNHTITYSLSGSKIASAGATMNAVNNVDLTSPIVAVSGCSGGRPLFSCPDLKSVNICFVVSNAGGTSVNDSANVTFDTTVSVRNVEN